MIPQFSQSIFKRETARRPIVSIACGHVCPTWWTFCSISIRWNQSIGLTTTNPKPLAEPTFGSGWAWLGLVLICPESWFSDIHCLCWVVLFQQIFFLHVFSFPKLNVQNSGLSNGYKSMFEHLGGSWKYDIYIVMFFSTICIHLQM